MAIMSLMAVSCGAEKEKPRDESFINIYEADRQGEKRYFSRELFLYPDGTAIITNDNRFIVCKVDERTDSTAILSGLAVYKDADLTEVSGVTVPSRFSVSWKGRGGVKVTTSDRSFKNFENAVCRYNQRITYYSTCHVLHENYLKTRVVTADDRQLASVDELPEPQTAPKHPDASLSDASPSQPTIEEPQKAEPSKLKKLSATGVPVKPDYSTGRSEGTLSDFHPENPLQFIDYYFGIIVFIFFLCELALLWYGKVADDLEDYTYGHRDSLGLYSVLCFILLLLESIVEIVIFTANPMVLFESDMPLFGCLGRSFFFFAMCIGQSCMIRIMRWKLHLFYGVSFIKLSWLLTCLSVVFVALAAMSAFGSPVAGQFSGTVGFSLFALAVAGVWLLSAIRLVRFIFIRHKAPLTVVLFYLLIYPLFIPVTACALALGLLGKIAAEIPDTKFEKIDDSDNHRYVTDALGNTSYLTNLGNGRWQDSEGNSYHQRGNTFTSNGKTYW